MLYFIVYNLPWVSAGERGTSGIGKKLYLSLQHSPQNPGMTEAGPDMRTGFDVVLPSVFLPSAPKTIRRSEMLHDPEKNF